MSALKQEFDKIHSFKSADEIYLYAIENNITGITHRPSLCVIAEMLKAHAGSHTLVSVSVEHTLIVKEYGLFGWLPISHETYRSNSHAMREFIRNFDRGMYPELNSRLHPILRNKQTAGV